MSDHAWDCLRAVLETVEPGQTVSSATWHDEAVHAQLKSGEIVAAQKRAVRDGWLTPVGEWIDGEWSPNMTRARHEKADGRWVALYRRTTTGQPATAIAGQGALFQ